MRLRLGTRGSALALWQARHVAASLAAASPGLAVDISIIKTEGDRRTDVPLTGSFGRGVFVREIEQELASGSIDLAVHSLKDLPTETPSGLTIAAVTRREDPRDALICKGASRVADLPEGARVATGSPRRRSQLAHLRADLRFVDVRGNVDTRLLKLDDGQFDALILAVAGLTRLGLTDVPHAPIPESLCLPAPGQGALAIETRAGDEATIAHVARLADPDTAAAVAAERSFLAALGAGCLAPAGALARGTTKIALTAMIGDPDGRRVLRDGIEGSASHASALGAALARKMLEGGGDAILRDARRSAGPRQP